MKKPRPKEKLRRGDAFVDEPTGSATQINLDGQTERRREPESKGAD